MKKIVAKHHDMCEASIELVEEGHAVSRSEGKRLFCQIKSTMEEKNEEL